VRSTPDFNHIGANVSNIRLNHTKFISAYKPARATSKAELSIRLRVKHQALTVLYISASGFVSSPV
jgi:hypothetical protein